MEWSLLIKCAEDTKLGRVASTVEDRIRIQNDFDQHPHKRTT